MGTMICLALGKLEVDWGKNNFFSNHGALFQAGDLKPVASYYAGADWPEGDPIVEMDEGFGKPLWQVRDRLELANTCPTAPTCRCTRKPTWTPSPTASTPAPARFTSGKRRCRSSPRHWSIHILPQPLFIKSVLHFGFETASHGPLDATLGPEIKSSLRSLKTYFGKKDNLLSCIRNNFSFHYLEERLPKVMTAFDNSHQFHLILSSAYANTLYKFADELVTVAMLQTSRETDPQAAMNSVVGDLFSVSGKMIDFLGYGLAAALNNRLGGAWGDFERVVHKIEPRENIKKFKVPFFFQLT